MSVQGLWRYVRQGDHAQEQAGSALPALWGHGEGAGESDRHADTLAALLLVAAVVIVLVVVGVTVGESGVTRGW